MGDELVAKALADDAAGVACRDTIGRHVFGDDGICADDGAVTDVHAGQHGDVLPDPHVAADDGIPLVREVGEGGRDLFPAVAEEVEGIGRGAVHAVICAVHDELNAAADGAEFADNELIPQKRIVMGDALFKLVGGALVAVIGVLPHFDVGAGDGRAHEADGAHGRVGVDGVRVGAVLHSELLINCVRPPKARRAGVWSAARI